MADQSTMGATTPKSKAYTGILCMLKSCKPASDGKRYCGLYHAPTLTQHELAVEAAVNAGTTFVCLKKHGKAAKAAPSCQLQHMDLQGTLHQNLQSALHQNFLLQKGPRRCPRKDRKLQKALFKELGEQRSQAPAETEAKHAEDPNAAKPKPKALVSAGTTPAKTPASTPTEVKEDAPVAPVTPVTPVVPPTQEERAYDELLTQASAAIETLQAQLKAKDNELQVKDDELAAKLRSKDDELKAKDDELQAKDDELKAKDDELQAKDDELKTAKEQAAAELAAAKKETERETELKDQALAENLSLKEKLAAAAKQQDDADVEDAEDAEEEDDGDDDPQGGASSVAVDGDESKDASAEVKPEASEAEPANAPPQQEPDAESADEEAKEPKADKPEDLLKDKLTTEEAEAAEAERKRKAEAGAAAAKKLGAQLEAIKESLPKDETETAAADGTLQADA